MDSCWPPIIILTTDHSRGTEYIHLQLVKLKQWLLYPEFGMWNLQIAYQGGKVTMQGRDQNSKRLGEAEVLRLRSSIPPLYNASRLVTFSRHTLEVHVICPILPIFLHYSFWLTKHVFHFMPHCSEYRPSTPCRLLSPAIIEEKNICLPPRGHLLLL